MPNALIWLLRGLGSAALLAVAAALSGSVLYGLATGLAQTSRVAADPAPGAMEIVHVGARQWIILARTLGIGLLAAGCSVVLAIPAAYVIGIARSIHLRRLMLTLAAWPLLSPPCLIGYSWTLLGSRDGLSGRVLAALGWNSAQLAPLWAGWVQACWLWPIPAILLGLAYRRVGRPALRIAMLDAGVPKGFFRAALPAMRPTALAAAGLVMLLSLADMTIAPLLLAHVWTSEINTEVARAARLSGGVGYLLYRSWPMLLITAAMSALIVRSLRRRPADAAPAETDDTGSGGARSPWVVALCSAFVATLTFLPMAVFALELHWSRDTLSKSFSWAGYLSIEEAKASLIVAGVVGVLSLGIGLGAIGERDEPPRRRRARPILLFVLIGLALLPAPVIGRGLIDLLDRPFGIPREWGWHPYDDLPVAWVLGMIARFGFLPMLIVLSARRDCGNDSADQARLDGASPLTILTRIRVPELGGALLAGAVLAASLSLSELQVSAMLAPPRWGESVAVSVDQQVHFGRDARVVAMCVLLGLPGLLAAIVLPLLLAKADSPSRDPERSVAGGRR